MVLKYIKEESHTFAENYKGYVKKEELHVVTIKWMIMGDYMIGSVPDEDMDKG